jgi:hypothetical protein
MKHLLSITFTLLLGSSIYLVAENTYTKASQKIISYAQNPKNPAPTQEDYKNLNILGINKKNINKINTKIVKIQMDDGDITYKYPSNLDYNYTFKNSNIKAILLQLENNSIDTKNTKVNKNTTMFLKIVVKKTPLGKFFTPRITIGYQGKYYTHTLEAGAEGIRYLNLSALTIQPHSLIKLQTNFITLEDQEVALMLFKNPKIKDKKILVIAPHPDDAEIAAYGLYSEHPKQTYIVTITAGDAGPTDIYTDIFSTTQKQFNYKGKRRTIDSITVPLLGGIPPERSLNLGYFDSRLYTMKQNKSDYIKSTTVPTNSIQSYRQYNVSPLIEGLDSNSSWNSLVNNLVTLLDKIQPDIIILPHPKLDRHMDHKLSAEAIFEALPKSRIRTGKLLLYTNHAIKSEYYPYGSRGEAITLPPEFSGAIYFNGIFSYPLSSETQKRKIFALEAMSDLRYGSTKSLFIDPCKEELTITCKDFSYVRRSVRSNELFFIIDIKNMF